MKEKSTEVETRTVDEVIEEQEAEQGLDISEMAQRVLIAAQYDRAVHGDETYDPERAADAGPWDEEELKEACEELVDIGGFDRSGDVYELSEEK